MARITFTPREIAYYVLLFFKNFRWDELKEIYDGSSVGREYLVNKVKGNITEERGATAALEDVFMNMDAENQSLLVDYVLKTYEETVREQREFEKMIKDCIEVNNSEQ